MKLRLTILIFFVFQNALGAMHFSDSTEAFYVKNLKVIFKPNLSNETISAQLYIKGGSLNLTESTQGIEQFIFSSVVLKDKKYAEKSWTKVIEGTGALVGALSTRNFTIISLQCTKEHFDKLWDVYADYVMDSGFYDERVEVTRSRFLTQIKKLKDSPDVYVKNLAEEQFYKDHPYRMSPYGTEASIKKIRMKDMDSYMDDHLQKSKLLLVVVGNIDKEMLTKKIKKTFGKMKKGKYKPQFPEMVKHDKPNFKIEERELPTNYIMGLFSAPAPNHPDYYAASIAIDILNSRFFEEIRTKRNLSYAPNAFLATNFANYGALYVSTPEPDTTLKIMMAEIKKMKEELVVKKDLKDRINKYLTGYYKSNESNSDQGFFLAHLELSGRGWQAVNSLEENLRQVTVEDVKRVANLYFKNMQLVYLGNSKLLQQERVLAEMF